MPASAAVVQREEGWGSGGRRSKLVAAGRRMGHSFGLGSVSRLAHSAAPCAAATADSAIARPCKSITDPCNELTPAAPTTARNDAAHDTRPMLGFRLIGEVRPVSEACWTVHATSGCRTRHARTVLVCRCTAGRERVAMKMDFDASVSRIEQLMRSAGARKVGRKHNHTPSRRVLDRRKAAHVRSCKMAAIKSKAFKQQVAAYWRGELDNFPQIEKTKGI